ncbi:GntR family transcriptional regulator [Sphaerotilus hippei]|uniref:Pyruvate dehydrogenase complex repressor n=1 Tax=Sphaerotilus hippei TaxID=744406 RepID=A0A318GY42_9BURK|nr:GntR family transcriptional regulator [Sphaerotilus hippei]PXW93520.1 GntR family transcriptional regulator [Sphaerotilus hippei]
MPASTAVPIKPLNVTRLSDQIVQQLETMMLEGSFKPGDRLPPERQLAEQLGVSRPSLREAIQKLAARGLVTSRQGGGTYVTGHLDSGFADPWQEMLGKHPELHRDVLEFRRMLEGTVAQMAAERATDADIERIGTLFAQMEAAHRQGGLDLTSRIDVQFHQALADAAHNALFTHLSANLLTMLHTHVHDNIANLFAAGTVSAQLLDQHRAVWLAVQARQGAAARAAAEAHIDFVDRTLTSLREESVRRERSMRRGAV